MIVSEVKDWGELLTGIGTIILSGTAISAFVSFRYQTKLDRLKWLQQLYDTFYNSERYKSIRQEIDFAGGAKLFPLLRRSDSEPGALGSEERNEVDRFTDYLNFFEWLAHLEDEKQLEFKDLDAMFNYYLIRLLQIDQDQQIRHYMKRHGYEKLHQLLNRYSRVE
jgi:hypothetical protein